VFVCVCVCVCVYVCVNTRMCVRSCNLKLPDEDYTDRQDVHHQFMASESRGYSECLNMRSHPCFVNMSTKLDEYYVFFRYRL
jgi:hypothetical protein